MRKMFGKWIVRGGIVFLLGFLLFNVWVLFFFPVDREIIQIASNASLQNLSIFDLTQLQVRWLRFEDPKTLVTFRKLAETLDTWESAKQRSSPQAASFVISASDMAVILHTWTSITPSDRLAFPRQPAEPAEIRDLQQRIVTNNWNTLTDLDQSWIGTVQVQKQLFEKMLERELSLEDLIQNAKSLPMISTACTGVQEVVMQLPTIVPPEQKAAVQLANARWVQVLMDSIRPNPEPLSALIALKDITFAMQTELRQEVNNLATVRARRDYLLAYAAIDFNTLLHDWPQLPPMGFDAMKTIRSLLVLKYTQSAVFEMQRAAIQSFCEKDSPMYTRLKVLPLQTLSIVLPQMVAYLNQLEDQLREIVTKQNMARLLVRFGDAKEKGEPLNLKTLTALDAFSGESLRVKLEEGTLRLGSAGYDKQFDTADDIVWALSGAG